MRVFVYIIFNCRDADLSRLNLKCRYVALLRLKYFSRRDAALLRLIHVETWRRGVSKKDVSPPRL
ncbi:MAG: hypothetical protein UR51_C0004G0034 [Candidatus Moranbacteria bacterium GW2011_GWF1_34_10]|nr:MAG: hypothetical protein UR51_C0004G0034 [Candidatus Moranbacteria bacterium GW2011_GWF1_34_10]